MCIERETDRQTDKDRRGGTIPNKPTRCVYSQLLLNASSWLDQLSRDIN